MTVKLGIGNESIIAVTYHNEAAVGIALISVTVAVTVTVLLAFVVEKRLILHLVVNVLYGYVTSVNTDTSVIALINVDKARCRNGSAADGLIYTVFEGEGLDISICDIDRVNEIVIPYDLGIGMKSTVGIDYEYLVS
jgi:hypothetical protein